REGPTRGRGAERQGAPRGQRLRGGRRARRGEGRDYLSGGADCAGYGGEEPLTGEGPGTPGARGAVGGDPLRGIRAEERGAELDRWGVVRYDSRYGGRCSACRDPGQSVGGALEPDRHAYRDPRSRGGACGPPWSVSGL